MISASSLEGLADIFRMLSKAASRSRFNTIIQMGNVGTPRLVKTGMPAALFPEIFPEYTETSVLIKMCYEMPLIECDCVGEEYVVSVSQFVL